jgi:molybdopterin molybdotransferase
MAVKNIFISVEEAHRLIFRAVKNSKTIEVKIENASGFVLSETLKSKYPSPPFHQSAMDGYAFRFSDLSVRPLNIVGEAKAGYNYNGKVKKGEAVRIFTGAAVPDGADTVVMQEKVLAKASELVVTDSLLKEGSNIRLQGSQIKKGATAILKGTLLNPGSVGYLAALGFAKVNVFRKPTIAIIVTGDELVAPGKNLKPGQIFESNSHTLSSVISSDQNIRPEIFFAKDTFDSIRKLFQKTLLKFDLIVFTGGISVGDYDFVGRVLKEEKVKTIFYKVKQKPGKPLFFGSKGAKYVFGLPGNPASVLTCYHEFVKLAIQKFYNHPSSEQMPLYLPLAEPIVKKPGLVNFLKGYTDFKTVTPLSGQESYILKSFISSNCLIVLKEQDGEKNAGDLVEVHLL